MPQLRRAAAALGPKQDEPENGDERDGSGGPAEEPRGELEEEVSREQRAQALRALQLARKRKRYTTEDTGMGGRFIFCLGRNRLITAYIVLARHKAKKEAVTVIFSVSGRRLCFSFIIVSVTVAVFACLEINHIKLLSSKK